MVHRLPARRERDRPWPAAQGALRPGQAQRQLFDDPIRTVGVRDHHPEDDFRRIHRKATAPPGVAKPRLRAIHRPEPGHHPQRGDHGQALAGYIPERMERVVSVAASAATHAVEQRWPVGILTNGARPSRTRRSRCCRAAAPPVDAHHGGAGCRSARWRPARSRTCCARESPCCPGAARWWSSPPSSPTH